MRRASERESDFWKGKLRQKAKDCNLGHDHRDLAFERWFLREKVVKPWRARAEA